MTSRIAAISTTLTALGSSVVSLGVLIGWWHLTSDAVAGVNLVVVNAVAVVGSLFVKPAS